MLTKTDNTLVEIMLEFVRSAVFEREPVIPNNEIIDWDKMMDMALEHGLLGWVYDGIFSLSENGQIPRQQFISWGLSAQEQTSQYFRQQEFLDNMIKVCDNNDMKLLLLKGISLSEYYPKPSSRLSCDIDIYLFGDYEKGNRLLLDGDVNLAEKHYVYNKGGIQVENHIWLIDMGTPLQRKVEDYLESTLNSCVRTEDGYYVLPSKSLVVYLLMHLLAHLNNPQNDPIKIKSIIDFGMVLKTINADIMDEIKSIIFKFDLSRSYMLFVELAEWALSFDLSRYKFFEFESKDIQSALQLILDENLRHPTYIQSPKYKEMFKRWSHYKQIRWRYKYLPTMERKRVLFFMNDYLHDLVKSLLGMSPKDSIGSKFKTGRSRI
jgi:hypothetical protein